jgi:glutamyl-tRNA synthetase
MSQITRLAPSPTGALHLGNARTFLINWLLARQRGWEIVLRIDDLDGPRIKPAADRQLIEDLTWLGLDWDRGPIHQSARRPLYKDAIERLTADGRVYPCTCSRKEVEAAASAPHAQDGASVYPGTCRPKYLSQEDPVRTTEQVAALRFIVPDKVVEFEDGFSGRQKFDVSKQLGDFVIAKADGTPAYQLSAVVDDADMGITDIVRGDDLLDSTPRQILLYQALGIADRLPSYYHLPLVVGADGRRLAKRHGDSRLSHYREKRVRAGAVVAMLAGWCGIRRSSRELRPSDLLESFRLEALPRQPIVFAPDDDARLFADKS